MDQRWHIGFAQVRAGLDAAAAPFFRGFSHGSASVELFEPRGKDMQEPHRQDELYIIRRGSASFTKEDVTLSVSDGDVLFVEAGAEHRFSEFSDDFSTWVIFWGPDGGETD